MTSLIDFDGINAAALRNARSLLPALIPGGTFRSLEYVVRNPRRDDKNPGSFKINYKTGAWGDFATTDKGGDFVSYLAFVRGVDQRDAAQELAEKLGVPLFKPNGFAANGTANGKGYVEPKMAPATDEPRVYQGSHEGPPTPVTNTADGVMAANAGTAAPQSAKADCMDFLQTVLAGGWTSTSDIAAEAISAGLHAEGKQLRDNKPLRDARTALKVEIRRDGFGRGAAYFWALPGTPWVTSNSMSALSPERALMGEEGHA